MFTIIGKGRTNRLVTLLDEYIDKVLIRYGESTGFTPLPLKDESSSIMPTRNAYKPDGRTNNPRQTNAIADASSFWFRHTGVTQALGDICETMLAEELEHTSVEITAEIYVAPAQRDLIKMGVTRKF